MSEVMTPMSFEQLVEWVLQEKKKRGTVFGQHHAYRADGTHNRTMFGRTLETPIGAGSRSAYADDTEYCGSLLCRQSFL